VFFMIYRFGVNVTKLEKIVLRAFEIGNSC